MPSIFIRLVLEVSLAIDVCLLVYCDLIRYRNYLDFFVFVKTFLWPRM